jgi:hypothetical protein
LWQQLPKYKSQNKEDAFSLLRKPIPKVRKTRGCQLDVKDTLMSGFFKGACSVLELCHQQEQETLE